jgi:hypothetical protein
MADPGPSLVKMGENHVAILIRGLGGRSGRHPLYRVAAPAGRAGVERSDGPPIDAGELDDSGDPFTHPDLNAYFIGLVEGAYVPRDRGN